MNFNFELMLFGVVALVALLTLALAFMLSKIAEQMSWKRQALWASGLGAFVPMSLPIAAILFEMWTDAESVLAVLAMLILAIILAAVVGFPTAYLFLRPRVEGREA